MRKHICKSAASRASRPVEASAVEAPCRPLSETNSCSLSKRKQSSPDLRPRSFLKSFFKCRSKKYRNIVTFCQSISGKHTGLRQGHKNFVIPTKNLVLMRIGTMIKSRVFDGLFFIFLGWYFQSQLLQNLMQVIRKMK